jgi:hypothetical protein
MTIGIRNLFIKENRTKKGLWCLNIIISWIPWNDITFFKRGPADPSQQCKTTSNSIQDPPPRWILTIFKLKFGGGNLFSPSMTSIIEGNNSVGSLLKPLLKKVTPIVGSRMLCEGVWFCKVHFQEGKFKILELLFNFMYFDILEKGLFNYVKNCRVL